MARLFASMGLLYAWATPEYLLWRMSFGQIIMYHNLGVELKHGKPKEEDVPDSLANMTNVEKEAWHADMKKQYGDTSG